MTTTPFYSGTCSVCGAYGTFIREDRPMRETYPCSTCQSSIRYREQARLILKYYAPDGVASFSELVKTKEFQSFSIYEPGVTGPFRKFFSGMPHYYRQSFFWSDVEPGDIRDGIECQDLMRLTYADNSFDLVITSDIFEQVRKPDLAFGEIRRVLRGGGRHIFTIPVTLPMKAKTTSRVDTSTDEDIHLMEPYYHGDGKGGRSLVYTDFGEDLLAQLGCMDFPTEAFRGDYEFKDLARILTFVSRKPV